MSPSEVATLIVALATLVTALGTLRRAEQTHNLVNGMQQRTTRRRVRVARAEAIQGEHDAALPPPV